MRVGSEWQQGVVGKMDFAGSGLTNTPAAASAAQPQTPLQPKTGQVATGQTSAPKAHSLMGHCPTCSGNLKADDQDSAPKAHSQAGDVRTTAAAGFSTLSVLPGHDKLGQPEAFDRIDLKPGELYALVGQTGAGKSRLIKDIEQLALGDTASGRVVLVDGRPVPEAERMRVSGRLVAHLGQNMRFSLDISVGEFLAEHCRVRGRGLSVCSEVVALANRITPEPVALTSGLHALSGGQGRALMIADVALVCDSPVVLIDEVENAGIDREQALAVLCERQKLVLIVTHDLQIALSAPQRIVLQGGAVIAVVERSAAEAERYGQLLQTSELVQAQQRLLREGAVVV